MLNAGADRVGLNTAAVLTPKVITESAERFGSQCVVVAVDVKRRVGSQGWDVYIYGGAERTALDGLDWIREVEQRGAGEILLTSMDRDGTQSGYDIELLRAVTATVSIPVIASGGAGTLEHFAECFLKGHADAVLAASLFHTRVLSIGRLKQYLTSKGVNVRCTESMN
jgi:cyclase